jgi:hypothetical protein
MTMTPLPKTTPPATDGSDPELGKATMDDQLELKVMDTFKPYQ